MGPIGPARRVIQLHPTRHCNLRCLHCYSASGPHVRESLPLPMLCDALTDAAAEGYATVALSGGEPLLYPQLRALLQHARSCGMRTSITSNGTLLDARRLETLLGAVDALAISLDGVPASHNRMRGWDRAFGVMVGHLDGVRAAGLPFGFIFTLTQHNVHELEWVASFALEQGASLLQVHPLEEAGRARELLAGARPDATEAAFAYLEVRRIQAAVGDRLRIHLNLAHRDALWVQSARDVAEEHTDEEATRPLAESVSPLIVEADGTVVPLQYGFARAYALGNLHQARLGHLAEAWRRHRQPRFRQLCRNVCGQLANGTGLPLFNWYEAIGAAAEVAATA